MCFMLKDATKCINMLENTLFLVSVNIMFTSKVCKYCQLPVPPVKQK